MWCLCAGDGKQGAEATEVSNHIMLILNITQCEIWRIEAVFISKIVSRLNDRLLDLESKISTFVWY